MSVYKYVNTSIEAVKVNVYSQYIWEHPNNLQGTKGCGFSD